MRCAGLLALVFVLIGHAPLGAQRNEPSPAAAWKDYTDRERHLYIMGFGQGVLETVVLPAVMLGEIPATTPTARELSRSLTPRQRQLVAALAADLNDPLAMDRITYEGASQGMGDIYLDPANAYVGFSHALRLALKRLHGVSQAQVETELQVLRRHATAPAGEHQ